MGLSFSPVTDENWPALERLFGPKGACAGCWCMFLRVPRKVFEACKGEGNRAALFQIVHSGAPTGILCFDNSEPVGWCAIAPREATPRLENSRLLARIDDRPVWSATCLYIAKPARRQGLAAKLLEAAVDYAAAHGARVVEGYPTVPTKTKTADAFLWRGTPGAFARAGFREVARRSPSRPIMRRTIAE